SRVLTIDEYDVLSNNADLSICSCALSCCVASFDPRSSRLTKRTSSAAAKFLVKRVKFAPLQKCDRFVDWATSQEARMRLLMTMRSIGLNCLVVLSLGLLITQPILAERPPDGDARPPIHVKGNSTKAPTGLSPAQVRKAYGFDQLQYQGEGQTIAIIDA